MPARPAKPELEQVYAPTRAAWRRWLRQHHERSAGVWLVFDKIDHRPDRLRYADAVEEALCFGWIDSLVRSIDEAQYRQMFTPRKPRSTWSKPNKERVERLLARGLMQPAGLAAIERAKANGSWDALASVDDLEIPDDLAAVLRRDRKAQRNFDAFPPSARRAYLYWIVQAKRAATRDARIRTVVELAHANRKSRTDS